MRPTKDYSDLKRDVFWGVITTLLFLFIFGGTDFVFRRDYLMQQIQENDWSTVVTDFTMIGLTVVFISVVIIGLVIATKSSFKDYSNKDDKSQSQE
jgi:hypothetical protein